MTRPNPRQSQMDRELLENLSGRVRRGLALPLRRDRAQMLALAQGYAEKFPDRLRSRATAMMEPLATAAAVPPGPRSIPTTLGALRALLAHLPDDTVLTQMAEYDPQWVAAVARVLAMVPDSPKGRVPAGVSGLDPRAEAALARGFTGGGEGAADLGL